MSPRRNRPGKPRKRAPPVRERSAFPRPALAAADAVALALIVATFSWICYRNIRQPGLYGDEAWATIAAARFAWGGGSLSPDASHQGFLGGALTTMLNPYTGPVKTCILAATFAVFGVTVPVLRATTGTVGLLGVLALYFLVRAEFGGLAAAAAALLLASDLSFVLAVRCDWGPIDFAFFARVASTLLLLTWRRNRSHPALLFLGALLLGLGLCFKFDFLGTVVSVAAAGAVFYGRELRFRIREGAAALGGFLLGSWPVWLYNVVSHGATLRTGGEIARASAHEAIWKAVGHRVRTFEHLLGGGVGEFIFGERFQKVSLLGGSLEPAALFLLPLLLAIPFLVASLSDWRRPLGFFVTFFLVLLLSIAAVPMAVGPHHVLSLYPFPQLLLGVGIAALWRAGERAQPGLAWLARSAAAAGFSLLLLSNLALAETFYERLASRGGARYWSESIYDLSAALVKDYPGDDVELLDWGFEQPLIILAKDRLRLRPLFWQIQSRPGAEEWLIDLLHSPHRVFVQRAPAFAFDATVHERFDAALRRSPDLLVEERKFFQKDGRLSFSLLKLRPRS